MIKDLKYDGNIYIAYLYEDDVFKNCEILDDKYAEQLILDGVPIRYEYEESGDTIKCPICGDEIHDSWEYGRDTSIECDECGTTYEMTQECSVTYTTIVVSDKPIVREDL